MSSDLAALRTALYRGEHRGVEPQNDRADLDKAHLQGLAESIQLISEEVIQIWESILSISERKSTNF